MDKRTRLFFALGLAFGVTAVASMVFLEQARQRERELAQAHGERERAEVQAEQRQPSESSEAAQTPPPTSVSRLTLRSAGSEAQIFDASSNRLVAVSSHFYDGRTIPGVELFGHPVIEVLEQSCPPPCNLTTRLFGWRERGLELFSGKGEARLQDLDGDGVPELLLEHKVDGTDEVLTVPFALSAEEGRFRTAVDRFPDGVARQLEHLSKAAPLVCDARVSPECKGVLRALCAVALVRTQEPKGLLAELRLEGNAEQYALAALPEVVDEVRHLSRDIESIVESP